MNKQNITSLPVVVKATNSERFMLPNQQIDIWYNLPNPRTTKEEAKAYTDLIVDAFKVANETGCTPSMLVKENQVLLDNAKFMNDSMIEVLNSEYTLAEIVSQRKVFLQYLKEAKAKLTVHNLDPLGEKLDEQSPDYDFIKIIDTLID
jgi:hypothetical protein